MNLLLLIVVLLVALLVFHLATRKRLNLPTKDYDFPFLRNLPGLVRTLELNYQQYWMAHIEVFV
jgi:hypothetical protein